jgi:hypothetical protein
LTAQAQAGEATMLGAVLVAMALEGQAGGGTAAAQGPLFACPSQQGVEAALAGEPGADCVQLGLTVAEGTAGPLCAIDFSGVVQDIAGGLAGAVADLPDTWWLLCEQVGPQQ